MVPTPGCTTRTDQVERERGEDRARLLLAGEIDMEEMVDIFSLMYSVQGFTEEEGRERAVKIFETLDKNGDGSLCEDEFIKVRR